MNDLLLRIINMKKIISSKFILIRTCILILIFFLQPVHINAQKNLKSLKKELSRLADLSGGKMGIGIIHLETDQKLFINNSERYPIAST